MLTNVAVQDICLMHSVICETSRLYKRDPTVIALLSKLIHKFLSAHVCIYVWQYQRCSSNTFWNFPLEPQCPMLYMPCVACGDWELWIYRIPKYVLNKSWCWHHKHQIDRHNVDIVGWLLVWYASIGTHSVVSPIETTSLSSLTYSIHCLHFVYFPIFEPCCPRCQSKI